MRLSKKIRSAFAALACGLATMLSPTIADAQTFGRSGTISLLYLSGGYNYAYRVYLTNGSTDALSDCPNSFAYVNANFDNYQTYVSVLTEAWKQGKIVNLRLSRDNNNVCVITEIVIS